MSDFIEDRRHFQCIVLIRMPDKTVRAMMNEDDTEIAIFASVDQVEDLATRHRWLQAFPYQIVELDEI